VKTRRSFSWRHGSSRLQSIKLRCLSLRVAQRICLLYLLHDSTRNQSRPEIAYPVPPTLRTYWSRNINRVAIDYANWPRLRTRLTLRRIILAPEPLSLRRTSFSLVLNATYVNMITSSSSSCPHGQPSAYTRTLFYRVQHLLHTHSFGNMLEPRYIFRAESLD
jgi:hypothetical protein